MDSEITPMPSTWRTAEIRAFALDLQPGFARQPNDSEQGILQLRMPSISRSGFIDFTVSKFVDATEDERINYAVERGDVIFNNTNSPELVGNAAVFDHEVKCVLSNHMTRIRVNQRIIHPSFLAAVLHRYWETGQTQSRAKQWINQAAIDTDYLAGFKIPLPPISEQRRIVEILHEAEEIRRLRAQAEAKTAELIPWIFHSMFGDPVRNPKKWNVEPLENLIKGTPRNGLYKPSHLYGEGTPIIRIGDFTGGILRDANNLQRVRISDDEITQFGVENGQILMNRVNSMEHLGKSLLVASLLERTVYESNMMRLIPNKARALPDYLIACLHHPSVLSKLRAKAKKAINQASINQTDVVTLEIPVPPLEEQQKFAAQVREVESVLSQEDQAARVGAMLESSCSAHAFSGQLTKRWHAAHKGKLARETVMRDEELKLQKGGTVLVNFSMPGTRETPELLEMPDELNREQLRLLMSIRSQWARREFDQYFTAEMLGKSLDGPLRRNPHIIEGHLAVLAARGLIIPVSREEQTADTGEYVFGTAYRLPVRDAEQTLTNEQGSTMATESGDALIPEQEIDHARLRELERLAAQLEKERSLT